VILEMRNQAQDQVLEAYNCQGGVARFMRVHAALADPSAHL
jgi:hypothetical protein